MKDHGMTRAGAGNIANILGGASVKLADLANGKHTIAEMQAIAKEIQTDIAQAGLLAKICQSVTSLSATEKVTICKLATAGTFLNGVYNNRNTNIDILQECLDEKTFEKAKEKLGVTTAPKAERAKASAVALDDIF